MRPLNPSDLGTRDKPEQSNELYPQQILMLPIAYPLA
jgi:hypothetical protein